MQTPNHVRITDFGLAKLLDYNEEEYIAAGGKVLSATISFPSTLEYKRQEKYFPFEEQIFLDLKKKIPPQKNKKHLYILTFSPWLFINFCDWFSYFMKIIIMIIKLKNILKQKSSFSLLSETNL